MSIREACIYVAAGLVVMVAARWLLAISTPADDYHLLTRLVGISPPPKQAELWQHFDIPTEPAHE